MAISMKCPLCGKRVFDTSKLHNTEEPLEISLKCPHCRNIVCVPITERMSLPSRMGGRRTQIINR